MTQKLCACGCGGVIVIKPHHKYTGIPDYINGHNQRDKVPHNKGKHPSEETLKKQSESHNGKKMLPQTRAALLKALTGRKVSESTRKKIKDSNIKTRTDNPGIDKYAKEVMTGGHDIVGHHVAYDFINPNDLVVNITRSFHGQIHSPKGQGAHERGYSLID